MILSRTKSLQLAALVGLALAFAGSPQRPATAQEPECLGEGECTFKKPVFVFVVSYATSMNGPFGDPDDNISAWQAAVSTIQTIVTADMDFLSHNTRLGVVIFGHDPDPDNPGTTIPGDMAGLVDGQKVVELWYDENDPQQPYKDCQGDDIVDAVGALPDPLEGAMTGIEPWTRGALLYSRALMETGYAAHPDDAPFLDNRAYIQIVYTQGVWTDPDGQGQSPEHDPVPAAADLFDNGIAPDNLDAIQVPTHVVYFGEPGEPGEGPANALAAAGGTDAALPAADFVQLLAAMQQIVQNLKDSVLLPNCALTTPRVMVILDASSRMLNDADGTGPAMEDESLWDAARYAVAGDPYYSNTSLFQRPALNDQMQELGVPVEDLTYFGMAVFGDESPDPGEQRLLAQYGPCRHDNFYWALSPQVSHPACGPYDYSPLINAPATPIQEFVPGGGDCPDPWQGSPIAWEFPASVDGLPDPLSDPDGPGFDDDTYAHMPRCDKPPDDSRCVGSGRATHLGLELVAANQTAYHAQALVDFTADESTPYINILITAGAYAGYSTNSQVQAPLQAMFADGVTTHVIGVGPDVGEVQPQVELALMAHWGSGGALNHHTVNSQAALEQALTEIINTLPYEDFNPCCAIVDCSTDPEPFGNEDPPLCECENDNFCDDGFWCEKPHPNAPCGICVPDGICDEPTCMSMGPLWGCAEEGGCALQPCEDDDICQAQYPDEDPPLICVDGVCVPPPCEPGTCPEGLICGDDGRCVEPDSTTTGSTSGPTSWTSTPGTGDDTSTGAGPTGDGTGGETTGDDSDDSDDSETTAVEQEPPGCGCSADERGDPRGLLALLALGAWFPRRRRRRASG